MNAKQHYDKHLAGFYSWMAGNFEVRQKEQEKILSENRIVPTSTKVAFDLGAGDGVQSISLANLGFSVTAVDFNRPLLTELAAHQKDLAIDIVEDDMLNFLKHTSRKAEMITCMGDTLTHLESMEALSELIREISAHLETGGKVIFSFRDLTTELKGEQRFIFVKSDETKILTCFLEYHPGFVMVHDILYENRSGRWIQKVSAYPKIRLNETTLASVLRTNDIHPEKSTVMNGMIYLIGTRIG